MYHCHTRFYCISQQPELFQILQEMPPLEAFTHEFFQSSQAEAPLAQNADVILADFRQLNAAETIRLLIASKNDGADLIILAEKQQLPQLTEYLPDITDIWFFLCLRQSFSFVFLNGSSIIASAKMRGRPINFWSQPSTASRI